MRKSILMTGISLVFLSLISSAHHNPCVYAKSDTLDLTLYSGVFRYPENSPVPFVKIEVRQKKLYASAEGFPETLLHFKSLDVFSDSVYGVEFRFIRTGSRVDTLKVDANGAELIAVRDREDKISQGADEGFEISVINRRKCLANLNLNK